MTPARAPKPDIVNLLRRTGHGTVADSVEQGADDLVPLSPGERDTLLRTYRVRREALVLGTDTRQLDALLERLDQYDGIRVWGVFGWDDEDNDYVVFLSENWDAVLGVVTPPKARLSAAQRVKDPPRLWVDYNAWGMKDGLGRVKLFDRALAELRDRGVEIHEGDVVRCVDDDADEQGRPCTLEVNAVVGWDGIRGWYADYRYEDMEWVPK